MHFDNHLSNFTFFIIIPQSLSLQFKSYYTKSDSTLAKQFISAVIREHSWCRNNTPAVCLYLADDLVLSTKQTSNLKYVTRKKAKDNMQKLLSLFSCFITNALVIVPDTSFVHNSEHWRFWQLVGLAVLSTQKQYKVLYVIYYWTKC